MIGSEKIWKEEIMIVNGFVNGNLEVGKLNINMVLYVINKKKLLVCFFGIFILYFYYGII